MPSNHEKVFGMQQQGLRKLVSGIYHEQVGHEPDVGGATEDFQGSRCLIAAPSCTKVFAVLEEVL